MNSETDATEDAFKKFKETWEPSDELADKAKTEEKSLKIRLTLTEAALQSAITELTAKTVALQKVVRKLVKTEERITDFDRRIEVRFTNLEGKIDETREWWDDKTDEIRKLMAIMVSMGFEINLD